MGGLGGGRLVFLGGGTGVVEEGGAVLEVGGTVSEMGVAVSEVGGSVSEVGGAVSEVGGAVAGVRGAVAEVGGAVAEVVGGVAEVGGVAVEVGVAVIGPTMTNEVETSFRGTDTCGLTAGDCVSKDSCDLNPLVLMLFRMRIPMLLGASVASLASFTE